MSKIYFQDYPDDQTLIKGYINSETKEGLAEVYKKTTTVGIDINENGVVKNPNTNKQYAYKFASEALDRLKISETDNKLQCPSCNKEMFNNHYVDEINGRIFGVTCTHCGYEKWNK